MNLYLKFSHEFEVWLWISVSKHRLSPQLGHDRVGLIWVLASRNESPFHFMFIFSVSVGSYKIGGKTCLPTKSGPSELVIFRKKIYDRMSIPFQFRVYCSTAGIFHLTACNCYVRIGIPMTSIFFPISEQPIVIKNILNLHCGL